MPIKALAVLDLAITVIPGADAAKLLEVGVKGAAKAGGEQAAFALVRWIAGKTDGKVAVDLSDNVLRDAFRSRKTGGSSAVRDAERAVCEACFPTGMTVATPHGARAIESLHVGDLVQAENPATGKVEAEAVQAVIQDPVSPLVAVDLSDGSAITVTADHPFWVDGGAQLAGAGWFAAGRLQAGDELRTAAGAHVMVTGLRRNVGHAVVYTLTVAKDHTFFVGSARVLVHNCATPGGLEFTDHAASDSLARHGVTGAYVDRIVAEARYTFKQADGATAYVLRQSGRVRRYSVAILSEERKVVTAIKDLTPQQLDRLAQNNGWLGWTGQVGG